MPSSFLFRCALTIIVLGCLVPVFALTSVTLNDGSVVRGTIVSESADFIVINADGADLTIPRATIQSINHDDNQALAAPAGVVAPIPSQLSDNSIGDETGSSATAPSASSVSHLGRTTREHVSVGVDIYWSMQSRFSNEYVNNTGDVRSTNNLTLRPYVGIRTSDILELRPALVISRTSSSTEYTVEEGLNYSPSSGTLKTTDTSSARLGVDFGCIFYPIRVTFSDLQ